MTSRKVLKREWDFTPCLPRCRPESDRSSRCVCKRTQTARRDIRDVRLALEGAFEYVVRMSVPRRTVPRSARLRLGALAIVGSGGPARCNSIGVRSLPRSAGRTTERQFPVPGAGEVRDRELRPISRRGRYVAFVTRGESSKLSVRPIECARRARIARHRRSAAGCQVKVFWSPDSSFIGFVADAKLKKVSISGGPPQTLTDVLDSARGTWGQQGIILIAPGPGVPIRRLPEAGGVSVAVTTPGVGESHFTPSFLPDGRHFLLGVR